MLHVSGLVYAQEIQPSALRQIQTILQEKLSRTPAQRKLDSHLHLSAQLVRGVFSPATMPGIENLSKRLVFDADQRVHVDIQATVSDDLLNQIEFLGGTIESSLPEYRAIRAWIPLLQAETLAEREDVTSIMPAAKGFHSSGPPTSRTIPGGGLSSAQRREKVRSHLAAALPGFAQDDSSMPAVGQSTQATPVDTKGLVSEGANLVQSAGYTGSGVKIGVLSDGVYSLANLEASGDLPTVTVLSGQAGPSTGCDGGSTNPCDEGTAMLETVHDLAPGAQLFFATGHTGEAQFATNIKNLAAAGCNIIVDDLTYFDEGVFQDGPIAQAVNTVTASGVLYFSSAQNSGNLDSGTSGTWEGDFNASSQAKITYTKDSESKTVEIHAFDAAHYYDTLTAASTSTGDTTLKWSDPLGASCNDYDMFVFNSTLSTVLKYSTNDQTCTTDPYEWVSAPAAGDVILVALWSGSTRALHLDTERGRLSIATSGATFGHNAAASALTVAATPAQATIFTADNQAPESYSSDGPRKIFYNPDGSAITSGNFLFGTNGGTTLAKVDLTAAGCGQTALPESLFSTFCGTSAAAPTAAALAALVKSVNPSLSYPQVVSTMKNTALPSKTGYNSRTVGVGIVMANLPPPSSLTPSNGATNQSTTPHFNWAAVTGASSYRILVATSAAALPTNAWVDTCSCVFDDTPTGTSDTPGSGVLAAGTTYYWEVQSSSPSQYGTWSGIYSFKTAASQLPTVSTGSASAITSNSATLGGTVNPDGLDTHYLFLYGTSSSLSGASQTSSFDMGSGTSASTISANIAGLTANTTYYYELQASNNAGTTTGSIATFKTNAAGQPPTVTTGSASAITSNSATLGGTVNPNGLDTHYLFLYGTSSSLSGASQTSSYDLGVGTSASAISANISGLTANTTYYFELQASNSAGTKTGSIASFKTSSSLPDLVLTSVSTPSSATVGGQVSISATAKNQGNAAAGAFGLGFYLSTGSTISTSSTLIATCSITSLAVGASTTCAGTVNLPSSLGAGTYHGGAIVDYLNQVSESNESNNTLLASNTLTVTSVQKPDLVVTSVSIPTSATVGGQVSISATAKNQGNALAGAFGLGFYLSTGSTISTSSTLIATCSITSLAVGASTTCAGTVNLPSSLGAGTYHGGAIVDYLNQVSESNESNNTLLASNTLTVTSVQKPDLVVTSVSIPTGATVGGQVSISATAKNQGNAAAGAFRLGFYLSTGSTISTSSTLFATCSITSLAVGATTTCAGTVNLPSSVGAGTYHGGAIVDDLNQVSESNESNNTVVASNTLTVK